MKYEGFRGLTLYQKSEDLVLMIYRITEKYPKTEIFSLVSQMRRTAVSIIGNISEGYGRHTKKDQVHFCYNARGSLYELESYIYLSRKLDLITEEQLKRLNIIRKDVGCLLNGYIKSLNK